MHGIQYGFRDSYSGYYKVLIELCDYRGNSVKTHEDLFAQQQNYH
jgi:hypothetical protein